MRPGLKCNSLLRSVGILCSAYAGAEWQQGIFNIKMGKAAEPKPKTTFHQAASKCVDSLKAG